jgi:hypothetical protein
MDISDPQIMAIVFIIPAFFGLALIGEGLEEFKKKGEWFRLVAGLIFVFAVLSIYIYFGFFKYL